ncbi:hypothetical protein PENTCL1PPCAC_13216, partial [Pristionchus entomophagus]
LEMHRLGDQINRYPSDPDAHAVLSLDLESGLAHNESDRFRRDPQFSLACLPLLVFLRSASAIMDPIRPLQSVPPSVREPAGSECSSVTR